MARGELPMVGILFGQFAAYHVDRCEAAAARLAGRYRVLAIEVASRSLTYAWEPSGTVAGAEKHTLFPGLGVEETRWWQRLRAQYRVLRACRVVLVGVPYSLPDAIVLAWLLRLRGVRVVVMTESKFDDMARSWLKEAGKALLLACYQAAIVGGRRQAEYLRFLGFSRRPILPGYDSVGIERVRRQSGSSERDVPWDERAFVYVGRFTAKKNLPGLVRGYARYAEQAGAAARRLILVGDGEDRAELESLVKALEIEGLVDWPGFLQAEAVSQTLARGLALCLVSIEEQWGLVVNEALAVGLPVIVSDRVGSRDALVRSGLNGQVVEPHDSEQLAAAMLALASNEPAWHRASAHSTQRAWLGDSERFADAVEQIATPGNAGAAERIDRFARELALPAGVNA